MNFRKPLTLSVLIIQFASIALWFEEAFARTPKETSQARPQIRSELRESDSSRKLSGKVSLDKKKAASDIKGLLRSGKKTLRASSRTTELALTQESTTGNKRTLRLKQSYAGIPIAHSDMLAEGDTAGNIEQINGKYYEDVSESVTPQNSAVQAKQSVMNTFSSYKDLKVINEPSLAYYPVGADLVLSWKMRVSYLDNDVPQLQDIYVNTDSLKILSRESKVYQATPGQYGHSATIYGNLADYEGGTAKSVTGWADTSSGGYYMANDPLRYFLYNDSTNSGLYPYDYSSMAYRPTSDWGNSDTEEFSLAYNTDKALTYQNQFGINGSTIAGSGYSLESIAHKRSVDCPNAYYSAGALHICDGFASLDVIAHELQHGVTEISSGLHYYLEPGALNESFSDVIGAATEFEYQARWTGSGMADWKIAEDSLGGFYRDMANPENSYPNPLPSRYLGSHWTYSSSDNGGVHTNSSVQNKFFYLLSEGGAGNNDGIAYSFSGIGVHNAGVLGWLTDYGYTLSEDGYQEIRSRWEQAARALNGSGAYLTAVDNAWDAVGVYATPNIPTTADVNFESGLDASWSNNGSAWSVDSSTGADGTKSMKSATIGNYGATGLVWTGTLAYDGFLSFFAKTSSEPLYDGLHVLVDGVDRKEISGENGWKNYMFLIKKGTHRIEFRYTKDVSDSQGSDAAWIDAISLIYPNISYAISQNPALVSSYATGGVLYTNNQNASVLLSITWASANYSFVQESNSTEVASGSISSGSTVTVPITLPGVDGLQKYASTFSFLNSYGNTASGEVSIYLDRTGPTTNLASFSWTPIYAYAGSYDFALSGATISDAGVGLSSAPYSFELRDASGAIRDSGALANPINTITFPSEGRYTLHYGAQDLLGNQSSESYTGTLVYDVTAPVITLDMGNPYIVDYGNVSATLPTARGDDLVDGTVRVSASGSFDPWTQGDYPISFQYSDAAGNISNLVNATVRVQDISAPTVVLNGSGTVRIPIDDTYIDSGAIWTDLKDGSGTISTYSGTVDTHTLWNYVIEYSQTDAAGNTGVATRTVVVFDPNAPTVSLLDNAIVTIELGSSYIDSGATWTDLKDGSGTISTYSGTVDISHTGSYVISYEHTDSDGLVGNASRTVNVVDTTAPAFSFVSGSEITVASGSVLLDASVSDLGGVGSVLWCATSSPVSLGHSTYLATLAPGINTVVFAVSDLTGNSASGSVVVHRVPKVLSSSLAFSGSNLVVSATLDFTGTLAITSADTEGGIGNLTSATWASQYSVVIPYSGNTAYVKFATAYDSAVSSYSSATRIDRPVVVSSGGGGSAGSVYIPILTQISTTSTVTSSSSSSTTSTPANIVPGTTLSVGELVKVSAISSASFGSSDSKKEADSTIIEHYATPILDAYLATQQVKDGDTTAKKKAIKNLMNALDKKIKSSKNIKEKYVYRTTKTWYEQQYASLGKTTSKTTTVVTTSSTQDGVSVIPNNKKNIRKK